MVRGLKKYACAASLLAAFTEAMAAPGWYVVTPYDNEGVTTVELRYWTVDRRASPHVAWPELGIGHGVTSRWTTFVYASYIGSADMATRVESLNWQNDFLLTQGQLPFDLAIHTNVARKLNEPDGHAVEFGPVLQTDIGRTQLNGNVFFERIRLDGASRPTQMKYQWQVRHRWTPLLNPGIQGFGEVGPWDDWLPHGRQSHRTGPALFGTVPLSDSQSLAYEAAYLVGKVGGRTADMFSMRVQYAF